jgi:hypothetical protein
MTGYISKGIQLAYKVGESEFTTLTDLQEIPDLGGDTESIEITTLDDAAHMYMNGLITYGDSLAFKFLYKPEQFKTLSALKGSCEWKVSIPDGAQTTITFGGECSVKLDSVGTNAALTYTLSVKPDSEMIFA